MLARSLSVMPMARKALALNAPKITGYGPKFVRLAHHGPPSKYKHPTMDDMYVPCGSWQEHYDNMQRKYNIQLLCATGVFMITMAVGYYSGAFDLYMFPPDRPSPKLP